MHLTHVRQHAVDRMHQRLAAAQAYRIARAARAARAAARAPSSSGQRPAVDARRTPAWA